MQFAPLPTLTRAGRELAPRLSDEEERSLLGGLAARTISGIQAVGNLLDLPGSTIRDVAGLATTGDFERYNPFDQWLSPFSHENRVTGRELLRDWGAVGPEDNWRNFIGGMALELGIDPLTYTTGLFGRGAKTLAGRGATMAGLDPMIRQAAAIDNMGWRQWSMTHNLQDVLNTLGDPLRSRAGAGVRSVPPTAFSQRTVQALDATDNLRRAAGKLGTSYDDLLQQPLRGAMGFGMPFVQPSHVTGFGPAAQATAKMFDVAGDAVKYAPGVKQVRGLFSSRAGNQFAEEGQRLAESVFDLNQPGQFRARQQWGEAMVDVAGAHEEFSRVHGRAFTKATEAEEAFRKIMMHAAELRRVDVTGTARQIGDPIEEAFQRFMKIGPEQIGPETQRTFRSALDGMFKVKDDIFSQLKAKGIKTADLEGRFEEIMIRHFPRYAKDKHTLSEFAKRVTPSSGAATAHRRKAIAGIPADVVDEMLTDRSLRTAPIDEAAEIIKSGPIIQLPGGTMGRAGSKYARYLPTENTDEASRLLAEYVRGHAEEAMFGSGDFADNLLRYMESAYRLDASSSAAYSYALENVGRTGPSGAVVKLSEALENAGFDFKNAKQFIEKQARTAVDGNSTIPKETADAIASVVRPHVSPEWAELLKATVGSFNRAFKSRVTLPFPAFMFRNHSSGHYLYLSTEHVSTFQDVLDYSSDYFRSWRQYFGMKDGIPDEYLREMRAGRLFGSHGFMDVPLFATDPTAVTPPSFLRGRQTLEEAAARVAESPNIIDMLPMGTQARVAEQTVIGTGAKAARFSEYMTRAPMYMHLRRKGYSPFAATQETFRLQFDYSDLASFEKDFARHVVPFYTFARKMSAHLADELIQRPGGRMGASIRTAARAHDVDAKTPDYVARTGAVPFGEQEDGTRRYMTGFGLPWEDPLGFLSDPTMPGAFLRNFGAETLARTTPAIKFPLEWSTGQSFFQRGGEGGRALSDMDPILGRTRANIRDMLTGETTQHVSPVGGQFFEGLVANSPYSRLFTTVRQMTDARKHEDPAMLASNMLTGIRFSHISPAAQDAVARELVDQRYKELGGAAFTRMHAPEEHRVEMPTWQQEQLLLYDAFYNTLADRAKMRSAAAEQLGLW